MSAAFTPNVNVALEVEDPALTVTVNVVDGLAPDGVPVIAPVEVFNDNPAGNDGDIEYVRGPAPPEAVIGVNVVAASPAVKDLLEVEVVAERGPSTASVLWLDDVPEELPIALVAVTVNV